MAGLETLTAISTASCRWRCRRTRNTRIASRAHVHRLLLVLAGTIAILPATATPSTHTAEPPDPFLATWARSDAAVSRGLASRTWIWGMVHGEPLQEPYLEAPDGQRTVLYTDKSRMEITDPDQPMSDWYVTNGLLARELMTGAMQAGNGSFEQREPADVGVAGDDDGTGPSYRVFGSLMARSPLVVGATITQTVDRDGAIGDDPGLASFGVTAAALVPETGHTIADVFLDFVTSRTTVYDPVYGFIQRPLFEDASYAAGLPLTEPYWTTVNVAGTPHRVLVQAFERRVMTYTPTHPAGWQVEAGNVGLHYYRWRYGAEPPAGHFPALDLAANWERTIELGVSVQGRPIEAIRLGDGPIKLVCVGGMHTGEELNSGTVVRELLQHFREHPEEIPLQVSVIFVPVLNVDGEALGTRTNANGVDLNRNWPADWESWTYHDDEPVFAGTAPLSEPETAALYRTLEMLRPAAVLSWHSYYDPRGMAEGNELPVGEDGVALGARIARTFALHAGYDYLDEWHLYPISGQFIDSMEGLGVPAIDVELPSPVGTDTASNIAGMRGVIGYLQTGQP